MSRFKYYFSKNSMVMMPLNRWDVVAFTFIFIILALIAYAAHGMNISFNISQTLAISLAPSSLPYYALRTVLRMLLALIFSLLVTFIFGTWAAKSRRAEKLIIPAIDVLQSVPILGFLSISVIVFIKLFPGSLLGPESAAIFAIFTSQAWNMILSFYQSLRNVPNTLREASQVLQLSAWQKFWKIEVPLAMPSLLWNMMMSMSASWFFVVASEAIDVANQTIPLPGIGSYIAKAIQQADATAIVYAIFTMLIVILLYDQLLFRPLMLWSEKFKLGGYGSEPSKGSWVTQLLQKTYALKYIRYLTDPVLDIFVNCSFLSKHKPVNQPSSLQLEKTLDWLWNSLLAIMVTGSLVFLSYFILNHLSWLEIQHVCLYGLATAARVAATLLFCTLVWVPIGVWIGLRPKLAGFMQPVMQFLAAFPANLVFPFFVFFIVKYSLNVNIWVTPLMILGTQWYVAFNVIAGTLAIPNELHLAADNFAITGWLRWQKLILPAIFPYYVTGAITAMGGAWNMSIVAEVVSWGHTTLVATGLGAYIAHYTQAWNLPKVTLGIFVMSLYVLILNRLLWRPLYEYAEKRFKLT
jgi:NitT/TauT family transport system permease protein